MAGASYLLTQLANTNNSIVVNRLWLDVWKGDHKMALFTSQVVFWSGGHSKLGHGRFYKTDSELGEELYLSRQQVQRCKQKLLSHPVIGKCFTFEPHKINGTPVTHWYCDYEKLGCSIKKFKNAELNEKTPQKTPNKQPQTAKSLDCPKSNNGLSEIEQSMDCPKSNSPTIYRSLPDNNTDQKHSGQQVDQCAEDGFKFWWKHYPKKVAKKEAFKQWLKITSEKPEDYIRRLTNHIVNDVTIRMESIEAGEDKHLGFDKLHPATYLKHERYNDEV